MKSEAKFVLTILVITAIFSCSVAESKGELILTARRRVETSEGSGRFKLVNETIHWDPKKTAIIVCDMWDHHTCKGAESRVGEMAPWMNHVLNAARRKGVFIVHSPSDRVEFYKDMPQRRLAKEAAFVRAPVEFKWNNLNPQWEAPWPREVVRVGCGCEKPCPGWESGLWRGGNNRPWTRQIQTIQIGPEDAITDSGQELYNLFQLRGIESVIIMGVHTNACVLGRPFGIRQMVYLGKNVVLCRDLTDSFYIPATRKVSHFHGTDMVIEHIEKYWCPTITSTVFTGKPPFRFKEDDRPRVVFIIAENEYKAAERLPEFVRELQDKYGFCCDILHGGNYNIPGMEALKSADLVVLYVRRQPLPPQQMQHLRDYLNNHKPLVGLRTTSHAFAFAPWKKEKHPVNLEQWPAFDREVLGCRYQNHYGHNPQGTQVELVPGMEGHPILVGLPPDGFTSKGSLYKSRPLAPTTQVLMTGKIPGRPPEPVAWTNTYAARGRVFYTSLGHPDDFNFPAFHRLLINSVHWALNKPVPALRATVEKMEK